MTLVDEWDWRPHLYLLNFRIDRNVPLMKLVPLVSKYLVLWTRLSSSETESGFSRCHRPLFSWHVQPIFRQTKSDVRICSKIQFIIAELTPMDNKTANKQSIIKNPRWLFFNDYISACLWWYTGHGASAFSRMNSDESLDLSTVKAEGRLQQQLNNGATWMREGSPLPFLFPRALWLNTGEESQALGTQKRNRIQL